MYAMHFSQSVPLNSRVKPFGLTFSPYFSIYLSLTGCTQVRAMAAYGLSLSKWFNQKV